MADGLLNGLIAAACWGSTDILAALAARRIGSMTTAALTQVTSFGGMLVLVLLQGGHLAVTGPDLALGILVGLISAVAYLSFYVALRLGPVAVVSPVGSAYGAVAVLLSIALLAERPSAWQGVGVVLTTLGILAISFVTDGRSRMTARVVGPGVPFVVVALLCWGLMTVGTAELVRGGDLVSVLFVVRAVAGAAIWVFVGSRRLLRRGRAGEPSGAEPSGAEPAAGLPGPRLLGLPALEVGRTFLAGLLDVSGIVAYAIGLQVGQAWLVGISSSFGPAVVFLFAVAFLGDRLRPLQWVGLAALGIGLVLVGLP